MSWWRGPGPSRGSSVRPGLAPRSPGPLGINDTADPGKRTAQGVQPPPGTGGNAAAFGRGVWMAQAPPPAPRPPVAAAPVGVPIESRKDLVFNPDHVPSLKPVLAEAIRLQVRAASSAAIGAGNSAEYDPLRNVILVRPPEFQKPTDEVRRKIAHELHHAVENRDVLAAATTVDGRKGAIDRKILAMSEQGYVDYVARREKEAEAFSWRCEVEDRDHFGRSKGWPAISKDGRDEIVKDRLQQFWSQTEKQYVATARERYRRLLRRGPTRSPAVRARPASPARSSR